MITIVSGLPRSGTSLMMQMLQAGGLPILCDDLRPADEDNPRGYLEFDKVRHLARDAVWMAQAEGRALKVVSLLLYHLPPGFEYRVVFMRRDLDEIMRSQERMLARRGQPAGPEQGAMRRHFERHLQALGEWLSRQSHLRLLDCHYADVIAKPRETARTVATFLSVTLDDEGMAAAVDPALTGNNRGLLAKTHTDLAGTARAAQCRGIDAFNCFRLPPKDCFPELSNLASAGADLATSSPKENRK